MDPGGAEPDSLPEQPAAAHPGLQGLPKGHRGAFPPGYGRATPQDPPGTAEGTAFSWLLPYVGQTATFEFADPSSRRVRIYECPSDPSLPSGGVKGGWGHTSYAGNGQVFAHVANDGSVFAYDETTIGVGSNVALSPGADMHAYVTTPGSFGDGAANTVVFAEKYAQCGPGGGNADSPCGNYWGQPWDGSYDTPFFAYALSRTRVAALMRELGVKDSWGCWGYYVLPPDYWIKSPGIGMGPVPAWVRFQVQPGYGDCNPFLANTGHRGGMNVALAAGSSRVVAKTVDPHTWWAVLTPNSKDIPGPEW